ncbi:MAG TPA: hypothetical protein VI362_06845 [Ignavibacteriaceae bacterium]|nr:hypothetical protein [Ignavibacteriaceae bacterium]
MALNIRKAEYFYTMVDDQPGEAYKILNLLANIGVSLLAFTAVPVGPTRTQFSIFPDEAGKLHEAAKKSGLQIDGPHPALLVQGDDELGALTDIHKKLSLANVNVYAASGVTDGVGSFGYVIYIRREQFDKALSVLGLH